MRWMVGRELVNILGCEVRTCNLSRCLVLMLYVFGKWKCVCDCSVDHPLNACESGTSIACDWYFVWFEGAPCGGASMTEPSLAV